MLHHFWVHITEIFRGGHPSKGEGILPKMVISPCFRRKNVNIFPHSRCLRAVKKFVNYSEILENVLIEIK